MDGYLGQILLFAGDYAPKGWKICDGSMMTISEYEALFSILGIAYGGDGRNTFALPDLRGRVPVGVGRGPGVEILWQLGQRSGYDSVKLSVENMPSHIHDAATTAIAINTVTSAASDVKIPVTKQSAGTDDPTNAILAKATIPKGEAKIYSTGDSDGYLKNGSVDVNVSVKTTIDADTTIDATGESQPHINIQPSLAMYYIICVEGQYPIRD